MLHKPSHHFYPFTPPTMLNFFKRKAKPVVERPYPKSGICLTCYYLGKKPKRKPKSSRKPRPLRVVVRNGLVEDVVGVKGFVVLDYDAVHNGDIDASDIIRSGRLKKVPFSRSHRPIPPGKIWYTAFSEKGRYWLMVGMRPINRFEVFIGDKLGWEPGTQFPFQSKEEETK